MKTLAVILFILIILPVYSQSTIKVKGLQFTIYFDRDFYGSDSDSDNSCILTDLSNNEQIEYVKKINEQLNIYSIKLLKNIPNEFYIVEHIKANGSIKGGRYLITKHILALRDNDIFYNTFSTFHHEIFHGLVHSSNVSNYQRNHMLEKAMKLSIFANDIPNAMRWDNGNPYYPLGFSSHYGVEAAQNNNIEEDLAMLFAQLINKDAELLSFLEQNPNSVLAKKVEFIVEFLQHSDSNFKFENGQTNQIAFKEVEIIPRKSKIVDEIVQLLMQ